MHISKHISFIALLFVLFQPNIGLAQKLVSKPFVGAVDEHSIRVWSLFKNIDSVRFMIVDEQQNIISTSLNIFDKKIAFKQYFPIISHFENLKPNTTYQVKYILDGTEYNLLLVKTESYGSEDFSFLTGSCAFVGTSFIRMVKPFNNLKILNSMEQDTAQLMLWLGDNLYYIFEKNSYRRQLKRNIQVRLNKRMSAFLNSKAQYAIWDDHDFGANNSGAEFKNKKSSLNVFQQFWANPKNETLNYFTFKKQDVQFFMLDDRFYKEDSTALGTVQLTWLKENLLQSDAMFKIIGIGTQALNRSGTHESFYNAKAEFDELMAFISENKISGIFFITGDRHFAELVKMDSIIAYPLYDFTTSPISMYPLKKKASEQISNPSIEGTYYNKNNYGKISIVGTAKDRKCILELKNRAGETLWQYIIFAKELQFQ